MTKQEFEERVGATVTATQYAIIETVYTYHPCIDEVRGKNQIAALYRLFGMRLILDMLPTAQEAKRLDVNLLEARAAVRRVESDIAELKEANYLGGYLPL